MHTKFSSSGLESVSFVHDMIFVLDLQLELDMRINGEGRQLRFPHYPLTEAEPAPESVLVGHITRIVLPSTIFFCAMFSLTVQSRI